MLKTQTPRI